MNLSKKQSIWQFKWHIIVIFIVLLAVIALAVFTNIFQASKASELLLPLVLLAGLVILISVVALLSKAFKIHEEIEKNGDVLEQIFGTVEKNNSLLSQICQSTRLSETAKTIAFRDADRQALREAVFDKLQQKEFDTAYEIIDEIAHSTVYSELAKKLRSEADKYRDASDQERISQIISHIEKLFENYQWAKASITIERLIKAESSSEQARSMRQRLLDKKQERKKALLALWDEAVKRQDTNQSLEILKELDLYLTPNEGLALQEAAKSVFRNKLHSLGVKFSLAVSEKQWSAALETGQEIMRDFPNSRMSEEIREKIDILKQYVEQGQQ